MGVDCDDKFRGFFAQEQFFCPVNDCQSDHQNLFFAYVDALV